MLRQRVITAIVLLAILLPALFAARVWPFAAVTLVLIAAAGWEWGRLNQMPQAGACVLGLLVALACAFALAGGWVEQAPVAAWWAAALLWLLGGALALRAGPVSWPLLPRGFRWLVGAGALWAANRVDFSVNLLLKPRN